MAYATEQDIVDLYGADALVAVADRDFDGVADAAAVARALDDATGEMDLHIGARYDLPLPNVPASLRRICIDIAMYRLATNGGSLTDEHRTRYEDAVATLKRIAEGKAALTFEPDPDADPLDPTLTQGPRPIITSGPPRLFSREKLRDI